MDAGKVTVKVELDASDIPSTLNRTVTSDIKPALAKAEREVDRSVANMRSSLKEIDSGVSGIAVASKLRPELEQAEDVVSASVASMQSELSNIGVAVSAAVGGFATRVGEVGAGAAAAGAAAGAGFVQGFGGPIAALGSKAGPIGIALAATAGIGLLAGKVLADNIIAGMGQLQEQANVAAKLGLEPEQMRLLGAGASEAYAAGFGESVAGNLDAVRAAVQGGILDPNANAADTEKIVGQLNTVAQVTGEEIPAAVRAAQQAVRTGLADDVTEAFDLITAAQQRGLNTSGDLFDTITEYGTQFRKIGLDGADAFGLIQQAVRGGARDTDKAADALKEFSIRSIDGSKLSTAAYENLGLSAKDTAAAFAQGGQTARDTFQQVIDKIAGIQDPVKKAAIQVALFGTQSEDLGDALNSMNLSTAASEFGEVAGAAQKASDTVSQTAAARWEQAKRSIEVAANSVQMSLAEVAGPAMEKLSTWIINNREQITDFFISLGRVAIDAGAFAVRGIGEIIKAVGQLGGGLGNIQGAVLKFQAWQADLRGDSATAAELRKQSEAAFSFGEGLTAVGESMANFDATKLHDALNDAAEKAKAATGETSAFNTELGALPKNGVDVPIAVTGIPAAETAMDDFFKKYRELPVGVSLFGPGGNGAAGGPNPAAWGTGGPVGRTGSNAGLNPNTVQAKTAVEQAFPEITTIGGWREPDGYNEHFRGEAIDVMIPNWGSPSGKAYGDSVAKYLLDNSAALGVDYVLWQQKQWNPDGSSSPMGDLGNPTDNHMDHVHAHTVNTPNLPGAAALTPQSSTSSLGLGSGANGAPVPATPALDAPLFGAGGDGVGAAARPTPTPAPTPAPTPVQTPGMPASPTTPTVAPPAPGTPPAPPVAVTVEPVTVPIVPLFTEPTDDPVLNALQRQADDANNRERQAAANKAATDAAQRIADAQADVDAALAARNAAINDQTATVTNAEKAKAEADYQDSLKALTEAQDAQTELLSGQRTDTLNDQIANRRQANDAAKEAREKKQEPFDYDSLPMGDPRRAAAAALASLGATPMDITTMLGGAAAGPLGAVAGDAVAAATSVPLPGPLGYASTPTAPSTDLGTLVEERNPLALAQAAGIDVPDYTREGGFDAGAENIQKGQLAPDAQGRIYSDTAALIDRTFTNADAADKARHDQTMAVLNEVNARLGGEVLGPVLSDGVTSGIQGLTGGDWTAVGTEIGNAAGPIIADRVAAAINSTGGGGGGGGILAGLPLPGLAEGGGITGGTPGRDSVPAMLMPGEYVLTSADVSRMGGFSGVEAFRSALLQNNGLRFYATGGNVGNKNANATVGADLLGVSQIPILGAVVNLLVQVLLKVLGVQIDQRDTLVQMSEETRAFRGELKAFDAAGRLRNDTSGLTDRSSTSEEAAAEERIRILKIVIDALVKYVIEKVIVPIAKAVGNALVQAGAGAASAAINTQAPGAGSIVGTLISSAGSAGIDIGAEIGSELAQAIITTAVSGIFEALSSNAPGVTTALFGGGLGAQIADPISMLFASIFGGLTTVLGSVGGLFGGNGSFDSGGVASGVGLMRKATIAPERVLSPAQTASFDRLVATLERGLPVGKSSTVIHAPISVTGNEQGARVIHDRLLSLTS